jgi:hypothetical protein
MQKVGTMRPIQIPSPVERGRVRVGARESTPSQILTAAHGYIFTALFTVVSDHAARYAPSLTLPRFAGEGIKRAAPISNHPHALEKSLNSCPSATDQLASPDRG